MAAKPLSETYLYDDSSLKLYLPFDNDIVDYSPSPLTFTDSSSSNTATAMFGSARNFNGSAYIQNATPTKLRVAGDKTVMYWLRLTALPGAGTAGTPFGLHSGMFDQISDAGALLHKIAGLTPTDVSGGTLSTATWYRIAYRLSGGSHSIFVNKTKTTQATTGTDSYGSAKATIGDVTNGGGQPINGIIDDFSMFTRALSDAELDGYYDGTLSGRVTVRPGAAFLTQFA